MGTLEIRNLHKGFKDLQVMKGLSLEIPEGLITVIVGGSGQGKSVLLKHIIGLIEPDEGGVYLDGKNLYKLPAEELKRARMRFGMLFQDAALFDSMNVYENISFPLREHTQLSEEEIDRVVKKKLEQIRLQGIEDKYPSELSGGMRKRVGLARAIALDPEIILYDEPTTGLDPIMTSVIDELIVRTHESFTQATTIIISHDIPATLRIANQVAMLHDGQIVEKGSPQEIVQSENPAVQDFLRPILPQLKGIFS